MFTVLIPFHGESAWLARCLAGLSKQDFDEPFEVVVVDNDTPGPAPSGVFERYRETLQLSVVRRSGLPSPLAMASARNRGLALAQYDWVVHMDADCVPGPEHLHRLQARITAARGENLLLFGVRRFINSEHLDEQSILDGAIDWAKLPEIASPSNYGVKGDRRLPELLQVSGSEHPWAFAQTCNLTHRLDAACGIGGFDEAFDGAWGYEDIEFAHRLITIGGARPTYVPGIEVHHHDSDYSSQLERKDKTMNPNWHRACDFIPGFREFSRDRYRRIDPSIAI
jgi:glycosyltransferase involved in cell wall biosynthesis